MSDRIGVSLILYLIQEAVAREPGIGGFIGKRHSTGRVMLLS